MPLPDKPNLEHLKKQANDLLKAYGDDKTEVSSRIQQQFKGFSATSRFILADAHMVIAREYGFSSWNKLKHYVEALETNQQPKLSKRKAFIQELVAQLLNWSKNHDSEHLGQRFAVMPLRDILAVRDGVIENKQHSLLVDGLLEGLKHTTPRVRYNCASALDHLADERCSKPLRDLLNDAVPRVRRATVHSLSCDACKVAPLPERDGLTEKLIEMALTDSNIRVRREAVNSLAESCDEKALAVLKNLLEDKDAAIRRIAKIALRNQ
jgi:hypothetical protein